VNKKIVIVLALAGACFLQSPKTLAQAAASSPAAGPDSQKAVDQDVEMLRQDIRSKKKQLVAANLTLTDSEATKFWPLYDKYTAELVTINNQKYAVLKEYAETWGTITDDQAVSLAKRANSVDEQVAQLRAKYIPIFNTVLPGKKTATFFQLDRRLQMVIDLQLSSQIPLAQAQP
jgi:hypothetical protein